MKSNILRYQLDIDQIPKPFYQSMGKLLADLHRIPYKEVVKVWLPTLTADEMKADMKRRMETVKEAFGVGEPLWKRWQNWLNQEAMWPRQTAFIHRYFALRLPTRSFPPPVSAFCSSRGRPESLPPA